MQDFIARGTGDSRFLKSVADFKTRYPTYDDFVEALVSGTLPVDFNGFNSPGLAQHGTPYNKASVLQDSTCTKLGIPTTSTPNDAFNALAEGAGGSGGYYGTCDSAYNVQEKIVTVDGLKSLKPGTRITVYFQSPSYQTDSSGLVIPSSGITLNVNGLGAIPVSFGGAGNNGGLAASWGSQNVVDFVLSVNPSYPSNRYWSMQSTSYFTTTNSRGYYYGGKSTVEIVSPGYVLSGTIISAGYGTQAVEFGIIGNGKIIVYSGSSFKTVDMNNSGGSGTYTFSFSGALNTSGNEYAYSVVCAAKT